MNFKYDRTEPGIIWVRASLCQRCGGLIVSDEAIRNGMGHHCRKLSEEERLEREQLEGQVSLFGSAD